MGEEFHRGFSAGWRAAMADMYGPDAENYASPATLKGPAPRKTKRKPTAYNNFVALKAKLPRFKYKSSRGKKKKGMTNMKAIGVAWRKLSKAQQNKYK